MSQFVHFMGISQILSCTLILFTILFAGPVPFEIHFKNKKHVFLRFLLNDGICQATLGRL